jgi:hypothetical protein
MPRQAPVAAASATSSHNSNAARPPRPNTDIRPENKGENRERDLRKAVSLSYLRQTAPKREKKAPTEEHLADLRAALASITNDVAGGEAVSAPATMSTSAPVQAPKTETPRPIESSKQESQKEVPEEILKKILEIE